MVERTFIRPPAARVGPISPAERATLVNTGPLAGKYEETIDRVSAYEKLRGQAERATEGGAAAPDGAQSGGSGGGLLGGILDGIFNTGAPAPHPGGKRPPARRGDTAVEAAIKSAARSAASTAGRQITNAIVRGVLGGLFRGR